RPPRRYALQHLYPRRPAADADRHGRRGCDPRGDAAGRGRRAVLRGGRRRQRTTCLLAHAGRPQRRGARVRAALSRAVRAVTTLRSHARFISLEGGEGAGKTTVLDALREVL